MSENATPKPSAPKTSPKAPQAKANVKDAAETAGKVTEEVIETVGEKTVDAVVEGEKLLNKGKLKLKTRMNRVVNVFKHNKTAVVGVTAAAVSLAAAFKILSEKTVVVVGEVDEEVVVVQENPSAS